MSYYNTTSQTGPTLAKAERQCTKQERYVLSIFAHSEGMTTFEVYEIIRDRKSRAFKNCLRHMIENREDFDEGIMPTIEQHMRELQTAMISIRRSVTDLADAGYLRKTDQKRTGGAGRENYVYEMSNRHMT